MLVCVYVRIQKQVVVSVRLLERWVCTQVYECTDSMCLCGACVCVAFVNFLMLSLVYGSGICWQWVAVQEKQAGLLVGNLSQSIQKKKPSSLCCAWKTVMHVPPPPPKKKGDFFFLKNFSCLLLLVFCSVFVTFCW